MFFGKKVLVGALAAALLLAPGASAYGASESPPMDFSADVAIEVTAEASPLAVTPDVEGVSVRLPGAQADAYVNYAVIDLAGTAGGYSYTVDGEAAAATPVLADGSLVKIAVTNKTEAAIGISSGNTALTQQISFQESGAAAPAVVYADVPMAFSEFYYSTTAAAMTPKSAVFAEGDAVDAPVLFITQGTRSGNAVGGTDTPTYAEGDQLAKVDAVSSATYGDSVHFVPNGNLAVQGDRYANNEPDAAAVGIKAAGISADFDMVANAAILGDGAVGRATARSTNVLAKLSQDGYSLLAIEYADGSLKDAAGADLSALPVYAAKPMLNDGNFGQRAIVNAAAAKALPGDGTGETEGMAYGGTWGDKVTGYVFGGSLAAADNGGVDYSGAGYWDNFFEYVYGGLITDENGHSEPLVFLQNLFSHRMHTDFDIAISPSRFSRLANLKPTGDYAVTVYAKGFEDINFVIEGVKDYVNAGAAIDGAATIPVSDTASSVLANLIGLDNASVYTAGAKLMKGAAEVPAALYSLAAGGEAGTAALTLNASLFSGPAWMGAYTIAYETADTVAKPLTFTLQSVERVKLLAAKGDAGSALADGYSADAPYVAAKGERLYLGNGVFAAGLVTSGRAGFSTVAVDGGAAAAIGAAAVKDADGAYYIDLSADVFVGGSSYALTLIAPGFQNQQYWIEVAEKASLSIAGPASAVIGDTLSYTVSAAGLGDVTDILAYFDYSANLEFVGVEAGGDALAYARLNPDGSLKDVYLGADGSGATFTLSFKAAAVGTAFVKLTGAEGANAAVDGLLVAVPDGAASTVSTSVSYDPYDFNRDGKVSLSDLALARQYYRAGAAAGGAAWEFVQERGIDVNGDGVVDLADFILVLNRI